MISVSTRQTKKKQCAFFKLQHGEQFSSLDSRRSLKFDSVRVLFFFFFAKDDTFLAFGKAVISVIYNFELQTTDKCLCFVCGRPTAKKESFSF